MPLLEPPLPPSTVLLAKTPIPLSAIRPEPVRVSEVFPDSLEWDSYVEGHPCGTPFHLNAWKQAIETTFRFQPVYVSARRNGKLVGVLPLFLVDNFLTGKALISTPYAVYGGALADDREVYAALAAHLRGLGEALGVQYADLRNCREEQRLGFAPIDRYVTFEQNIGPDEAAILESIPRKTRRMVRKSTESGFSTRIQDSEQDGFEDLYLRSLQRLGTPAFPSDHFANLLHYFKGSVAIHEHHLNGKLAAAVLTFRFRDRLLPYYGASDPEFNAAAPNNFMYFEMMRWGGANGYAVFDFGRSKKLVGGSYDFKAHWGMTERTLPYEILLVRRKDLPNFSPANPAFDLPMKIWRKLPLGVTKWVGPRVIRMVP